jgi:hypothetical protein
MDQEPSDSEVAAPGWDAIASRLAPLYGDQEPRHWGSVVKYRLGGPDPLDGISAYHRLQPEPHWHFVTYGFSELYAKESKIAETSGFGFELTFRLACGADDTETPKWPVGFLNNLARYVFEGHALAPGHHMNLNGPIALGRPTDVTAIAVVQDPELAPVETPNGSLRFLQVFGLTSDEYLALLGWTSAGLVELMRQRNPVLVTSLSRASLLADPAFRAEVTARSRSEGSSTDRIVNDGTTWKAEKRLFGRPRTVITLRALAARQAAAILPARLLHGRPFTLAGRGQRVTFRSGDAPHQSLEGPALELTLPAGLVPALVAALGSGVGLHAVEGFERLSLEIEPSLVRDAAGQVVEEIR